MAEFLGSTIMTEETKRKISESMTGRKRGSYRPTLYERNRQLEQLRKATVSAIMEMTDDELRAHLRYDLYRGNVFPLEEELPDEKDIWYSMNEFLLTD